MPLAPVGESSFTTTSLRHEHHDNNQLSKEAPVMRWLLLVIITLAVGAGSPIVAQEEDAHIGTWKLNIGKSKVTPAPTLPPPQSVTRTYQRFGDGLQYRADVVNAAGRRTTTGWSVYFDGKDYPFVGSTTVDTIALKKVDNYTFESVMKKGGKVVTTGTNTVSKDRRTMTWSFKGTNAQGQPVSGVQVFEKQ